MFKYIALLLLLNFNYALANTPKQDPKLEETKKVLQTLLPFNKKGAKSAFTIDKCKIDQKKWMMLLVARQPFTEKITFNQFCNIQGQYTAKMEVPFPVKFELQKLENFDQVSFNFLIKLIYEPVPMIKIYMQNGKLKGKSDTIIFDLEYEAEIDPLSKEFIKKDKGGFITIHSINGKKVKQKIKIKR